MKLENLQDDGDTIDLGDGSSLRLRIEPDMDYNPFEECDAYGKLAGMERDSDTGRSIHPRGFDGNAEKLAIFNDVVWWQPPADGLKRSDPEFPKFRSFIAELASFGCKVVTLELLKGEDAYGRPIVIQVTSLGGIDSLEDGCLADLVQEMAAELGVTD